MKSNKPFFIFLVGIVCLVVVVAVVLFYYDEWGFRRGHELEIEQAFNKRLVPAAAFMRGFMVQEHRLPSNEEMERARWKIGSIGLGRDEGIKVYRERPKWLDKGGVFGTDFLLETEVPNCILFYQSWDNKRIVLSMP